MKTETEKVKVAHSVLKRLNTEKIKRFSSIEQRNESEGLHLRYKETRITKHIITGEIYGGPTRTKKQWEIINHGQGISPKKSKSA